MEKHITLPALALLAALAARADAAPPAGLDANGHLLPVAAATASFTYAPIADRLQVRLGAQNKKVIF